MGNVSKGMETWTNRRAPRGGLAGLKKAICANSQPLGTPRWCSKPKLKGCGVVDKTTAMNQNGCRAVCIKTCLWAQGLLYVLLMVPVNGGSRGAPFGEGTLSPLRRYLKPLPKGGRGGRGGVSEEPKPP